MLQSERPLPETLLCVRNCPRSLSTWHSLFQIPLTLTDDPETGEEEPDAHSWERDGGYTSTVLPGVYSIFFAASESPRPSSRSGSRWLPSAQPGQQGSKSPGFGGTWQWGLWPDVSRPLQSASVPPLPSPPHPARPSLSLLLLLPDDIEALWLFASGFCFFSRLKY